MLYSDKLYMVMDDYIFYKRHKTAGFTLAEVLITLGIIGVVATMTIPTLIQNYNTRTWNTGAALFEKKLEQALKIMNSQQMLTGHTSSESFVEELSKHMKINKICSNDNLLDCFSEIVYWGGGTATPEEVNMNVIKSAKHFGQINWNTNIIGVQFLNGTNALIAYNPTSSCQQDPYSNQVAVESCLAILYDTSGLKAPNTSGKDLRNNVNVLKLNGCAFEIGDTCYSTSPFVPTPVTKAECELLKEQGYGIKGCRYDTDYWAGAVKACGGVNNLPSDTQLAQFADFVYGTSGIGKNAQVENLTLNPDKVISLGFKLNSSGNFFIWANQEYATNGTYAYIRYFYPTYTKWDEPPRTGSSYFAMCVANEN